MAEAHDYDLVVLDVMLPDGDGYALCRQLRAAGNQARVLMLTARALEDDLVTGLDAGADDYLVKPYRMRELLARVRALLRRGGEPALAAPVLVAGPIGSTCGRARYFPTAATASRSRARSSTCCPSSCTTLGAPSPARRS